MRHYLLPALVCVALMVGTGAAIATDTALQAGVPATLALPASTYISNYYIDVDSASKQLRVSVAASGGDVDLFVRCGSPFPQQGAQPVSEDLLNRYAHYHSVSSGSNESILILPSSRVPLFCPSGRWYIAVINSGTTDAGGTLTAATATTIPSGSITLDFQNPSTDPSDPTNNCEDSFWTDATVVAPVSGNPGTTLGQQRKNALVYAAQQLAQQLHTSATITVHACGAHLGGDAHSAILAHAAPLSYFFDEPLYPLNSLPKKYTWYPAAAIANLNGTGLCGFAGGPCGGVDNEEIEITFNEDIGKSTVIGGEDFYLGYQATTSPNALDFITIAMHEMTHGLGFFGLVNTDPTLGPLGAKAGIDTQANSIGYENIDDGPYDDIYDDSVAIVNGSTYTPFTGYEVNGSGDAARATALVSGATVTSAGEYIPGLVCTGYTGPCTGLRWMDSVTAGSSTNSNAGHAAPNDFPSLYAPCDKSSTTTCTTQPASTLSHTVQDGDMMNAYYNYGSRSMGLAAPMLAPIGWSTALSSPPAFTQPFPSNWFDGAHSGHGFDFQLGYHDPLYGDVYIFTFYSYEADGTPEWYQAVGPIIDGVFVPNLDSNGNTLTRAIYTSNSLGNLHPMPDPSVSASVVVDFNQAANAPVCRNQNRSQATLLGVMSWSIGNDSGLWCVEPIVRLQDHATPDYNGHWFAGSDSGWGFELLDVDTAGTAGPTIVIYVYYPGPNNQPTWATASGLLVNGTTGAMPLLQVSNGFCRTCTPHALTGTQIGTMSITLDPVVAGQYPTGTASIQASYAGGGGFNRSNIGIQMLSLPTGQ